MIETAEILLGRHGKSRANAQNLAFGNKNSPLTEKGIAQSWQLEHAFKEKYGISPAEYRKAVAVSEFLRAKSTAHCTGFMLLREEAIINEYELPPGQKTGILMRHRREGYVPPELSDRAAQFMEDVRSGNLPYKIFFTHGFFIAAVLDLISKEHEARGEVSPHVFNDKALGGMGYIPDLATLTAVDLTLAA